jgi:hypothetical protein
MEKSPNIFECDHPQMSSWSKNVLEMLVLERVDIDICGLDQFVF